MGNISSYKIPQISISRLSIYARTLKELVNKRARTVSSQQLAREAGATAAKVRKDLSYFGQFGRRGVGYDVEQLSASINKILGLDRTWNMAICGAGNLGSALCNYKGFSEEGFKIVAIFDNNKNKIGKKWQGIEVSSSKNIISVVKNRKVDIAIIAVPTSVSQEVVNDFVKAGVKAILNFAPIELSVSNNVKLRNVDLSLELGGLTHFLCSKK